jgi:hypothetical protein
LPRNHLAKDTDAKQHLEWIEACKGGPTPYSQFEIAAYLTEIILLGCVALRVGKKLEWDGPKIARPPTAPECRTFRETNIRTAKGFGLAWIPVLSLGQAGRPHVPAGFFVWRTGFGTR